MAISEEEYRKKNIVASMKKLEATDASLNGKVFLMN
jgi:hypothetical protein